MRTLFRILVVAAAALGGWAVAAPTASELKALSRDDLLRLARIASSPSPALKKKGALKSLESIEGLSSGVAAFAKDVRVTETVYAINAHDKTIWGEDNRCEPVHAVCGPALGRTAADSVAAFFSADVLVDDADGVRIRGARTLGSALNTCANTRYAAQPVAAFCTGFIVAPDVLATAGHCIDQQTMGTARLLFGYQVDDAGKVPDKFPKKDVYKAAALIARKLTPDGEDWALLRLDRPVQGRNPLKVRRSGKVPDAAALFVLGYPTGLPLKLAGQAGVKSNTHDVFFLATLDTFHGNSGSPVFSEPEGLVEGVLVRGAQDYLFDPVAKCNALFHCQQQGCDGEAVTRCSRFVSAIP